jgi:hypothetical protein
MVNSIYDGWRFEDLWLDRQPGELPGTNHSCLFIRLAAVVVFVGPATRRPPNRIIAHALGMW